jgi:hypothetical protein
MLIGTTVHDQERSGAFAAGEEVVFSFTFDNILAPGRYDLLIELAHRGSGFDLIDRFEGEFSFVVTGRFPLGGLVDLPVEASFRRQVADTDHQVTG